MSTKNKVFVWALLLIPMIMSMAMVNVGSAVVKPNVSLEPSSVGLPSEWLIPGSQFSLDLDVDYVYRLWGYQLTLSFNPSVLHGVSVDNGPFLESNEGTASVVPGPGFDNEVGTLGLFGAVLDPVANFATGGSAEFGPLATLTFEVVGFGTSPIALGPETGLANSTGGWIVKKATDPESFFDAYFDNQFAGTPQLWIREAHGTFGGGAYPAWHVNLLGVDQILYSKIASSGDMAAWVKVKFTVKWIEGAEAIEYWSGEVLVPAVYIDPETGEKVYPLVTVATAPFTPPAYGHYTVTAALYFKPEGMTNWLLYEDCVQFFGGTGIARDPATKFKVAEHM